MSSREAAKIANKELITETAQGAVFFADRGQAARRPGYSMKIRQAARDVPAQPYTERGVCYETV